MVVGMIWVGETFKEGGGFCRLRDGRGGMGWVVLLGRVDCLRGLRGNEAMGYDRWLEG